MTTSPNDPAPMCPRCGADPKPLEKGLVGEPVYSCSACDYDYRAPEASAQDAPVQKAKDELGRKVCSACNGRRRVPKVDVVHAKTTWVPCKKCGGTGIEGPDHGLYVVPIKGQPLYYRWYEKDEVVAQMLIVAIPQIRACSACKGTGCKDGKPPPQGIELSKATIDTFRCPECKGDTVARRENGKQDKYIIAEIHAMWTDPEYRRTGIMTKMLDALKTGFQGEVRFVLTNWKDSTEKGRSFLLKRGFRHEKEVIVWDRLCDADELSERSR